MNKTLLPKKIWLAGLGAISRAEKEGETWLEELMSEGEVFEQDKKEDLDQALLNMTEKVQDGKVKVKHRIENIEHTFESKVSSTLGKLGIVSKNELHALRERLEELEKKLT